MNSSVLFILKDILKMWVNEIMETLPYYDTLLLVQFILYTLQMYWIISKGIQLEDGVEWREESNLGAIPCMSRHSSHLIPFMAAEMPLAVAVSSQSLLHTLLHRYYIKSTVWVTCGKEISLLCV